MHVMSKSNNCCCHQNYCLPPSTECLSWLGFKLNKALNCVASDQVITLRPIVRHYYCLTVCLIVCPTSPGCVPWPGRYEVSSLRHYWSQRGECGAVPAAHLLCFTGDPRSRHSHRHCRGTLLLSIKTQSHRFRPEKQPSLNVVPCSLRIFSAFLVTRGASIATVAAEARYSLPSFRLKHSPIGFDRRLDYLSVWCCVPCSSSLLHCHPHCRSTSRSTSFQFN